MKACQRCGRLFPDDAGFCPVDGTELISATDAPPLFAGGDGRVGTVLLDRYHVRRVVADGGMGRVYEALDLTERRNVAVKILHPDISRDEVQVSRFRREYEVSAQLPHEHIAQVFDFRMSPDGEHVLVMEYLYGEELRSTLAREKVLSPARLVRMVSQIAIGLDGAHRRGLVHRDLKPDNIFLCQTADGDRVKILDFGSVKDTSRSAKKLTVLGTTIGSPYYMSPEQAQGSENLDGRADVWSLAAICFECLVGQVPFPGNSGPMVLALIMTKDAPKVVETAWNRGVTLPWELNRVIDRGLSKSAVHRFATVGAFADAFGRAWGLKGDHQTWSEAAETGLAIAIEKNLEQLLKESADGPPAPTAEDAFFGATDALVPSVRPLAQSFPPTLRSDPPVDERDSKSPGDASPRDFGGQTFPSGSPLSGEFAEGTRATRARERARPSRIEVPLDSVGAGPESMTVPGVPKGSPWGWVLLLLGLALAGAAGWYFFR